MQDIYFFHSPVFMILKVQTYKFQAAEIDQLFSNVFETS